MCQNHIWIFQICVYSAESFSVSRHLNEHGNGGRQWMGALWPSICCPACSHNRTKMVLYMARGAKFSCTPGGALGILILFHIICLFLNFSFNIPILQFQTYVLLLFSAEVLSRNDTVADSQSPPILRLWVFLFRTWQELPRRLRNAGKPVFRLYWKDWHKPISLKLNIYHF
jgi:hypothetical protein